LVEAPNRWAWLLGERSGDGGEPGEEDGTTAGAAVFAGIEGTRPLLVEIQALVAPSLLGTPRRAVVGWDATRLAMITAVLDARCGLSVGANDIYLNIAGGLRIVEPAADLAVAAALVSALRETPVPADAVVFGEIALSGDVRPVGHTEARIKEAAKLGFAQAWLPIRRGTRREAAGTAGIETATSAHLSELVDRLAPKRALRGQPLDPRRRRAVRNRPDRVDDHNGLPCPSCALALPLTDRSDVGTGLWLGAGCGPRLTRLPRARCEPATERSAGVDQRGEERTFSRSGGGRAAQRVAAVATDEERRCNRRHAARAGASQGSSEGDARPFEPGRAVAGEAGSGS